MLRVSALLFLTLTACNRDQNGAPGKDPNAQDHAGTTTLTSAGVATRESAIDRMVIARCARAVTCSNLGPDKHLPDESDHCVPEVRDKLSAELSPDDCPGGINAKELDDCLAALREESCSNPLSTMGRLARCRTSSLCLKAAH